MTSYYKRSRGDDGFTPRPRLMSLMGGYAPAQGKYSGKKFYKRKPYSLNSKYAAKLSPAIRNAIKGVIRRGEEVKVAMDGNSNDIGNAFNNTSWNSTGLLCLTPTTGWCQIVQGNGKSDRLGDSVNVRSVISRMIIWPKPYHATTNPTIIPREVMIIIFGTKVNDTVYPTGTTGVSTLPSFFMANDGVQNFVGSLADVNAPINTDLYTIYEKRVVKLGFAASVIAAGGDAANAYFANNDYKMNCIVDIDVTKYCPKKFRFQDNSTGTTTRNVYMMLCPMAANNATPIATEVSVGYTQYTEIKFTD